MSQDATNMRWRTAKRRTEKIYTLSTSRGVVDGGVLPAPRISRNFLRSPCWHFMWEFVLLWETELSIHRWGVKHVLFNSETNKQQDRARMGERSVEALALARAWTWNFNFCSALCALNEIVSLSLDRTSSSSFEWFIFQLFWATLCAPPRAGTLPRERFAIFALSRPDVCLTMRLWKSSQGSRLGMWKQKRDFGLGLSGIPQHAAICSFQKANLILFLNRDETRIFLASHVPPSPHKAWLGCIQRGWKPIGLAHRSARCCSSVENPKILPHCRCLLMPKVSRHLGLLIIVIQLLATRKAAQNEAKHTSTLLVSWEIYWDPSHSQLLLELLS